jgi:hypothetical protein
MNLRLASTVVLGLALSLTAAAQDANSAQPPAQQSGGGGWQGQRGGRGQGAGFGMGGRGLMGTVTEAAADHYTIKTETGENYTVHFTTSTRIFKQAAGRGFGRGQGNGAGQAQPGAAAQGQGTQPDEPGQGIGANQGQGGGRGYGRGNPPQQLQPSDIKVGDAIGVMGSVDANAKSVAATAIVQIDPERAQQMAQMQANFGKTWLMGRVTAIDGVKVTLTGSMDNAAHSFVADENTTFRKRRDPITLADIQVGDMVRADGAIKDGVFVAATVNAMTLPPGGPTSMPRNGPSAGAPPAAPPQ